MIEAAREVVVWANNNQDLAEDGLVVLVVSTYSSPPYTNDDAVSATVAALEQAGIPTLFGAAGCLVASDLTLGSALDLSLLTGGGHVLALVNCPGSPTPTYNPTLGCSGFLSPQEAAQVEEELSSCLASASPSVGPAAVADAAVALKSCALFLGDLRKYEKYACYADPSPLGSLLYPATNFSSPLPFSALKEWNVAAAAYPLPSAVGSRGLLTFLQGAWAQDDVNTVLSFFLNSSLVEDERRSGLNAQLAEWIRGVGDDGEPLLKNVNGVGINFVCDGGKEVRKAMKERMPTDWA